ncbi:MAG TPA: hypothetical protein VF179_16520 [Thermoanaerobaculia bacterium]|nr:hypothetical protein [Thermoanaerobaculia bacterium]
MRVEHAIVEMTRDDLDPDAAMPTAAFVSRVEQRLARRGSTRVPGFVIIPETSHLLKTRSRFNRFIDNTLDQLLKGWSAAGSEAISSVDYLYASGRRIDNYYRMAQLRVDRSRLIGAPQTSFFLHTDYLRIQYSAISYGGSRNVQGGTLRIFDALRLQEEEGIPLMDLVTIKVPAKKSNTLNDRQFYCVARMDVVGRHPRYMARFPVVSARSPLVIVSNRYPHDGLMHGPTRIHKKDPARPLRRPSYLATISAEYLSKEQMCAL